MININNISIWTLLVSLLLFSAIFIGGYLLLLLIMVIPCKNKTEYFSKTNISILIVSILLIPILIPLYKNLEKQDMTKNINQLSQLQFLQIETENNNTQNKQCYLYFADEKGQIYRYYDSHVKVNSNINTTEYSIEYLDNQIIVNVPWTIEALNYAIERDVNLSTFLFEPIIEHPVLGCILHIALAEFILIGLLIVLEIYRHDDIIILKNYKIIYIIMIVIIPIIILHYVNRVPEIRQENLEQVNQLEIVQGDNHNNIYCADENGNVYVYNENELPVDFTYNINYKDFVFVEDYLHMPFNKNKTKLLNQ